MPFYSMTDRAQLVDRYTFLESAEEKGPRFARDERSIEDGKGDRYDELYLGFNYFWYGHKLEIQNGMQYVYMGDFADHGGSYSDLSWTTGFRISWQADSPVERGQESLGVLDDLNLLDDEGGRGSTSF